MADTSLYHVFSGEPDKEPRWLCSLRGVDLAMQEMANRSGEEPGSYFVFSVRLRKLVASINTSTGDAEIGNQRSA